MSAMMSAANMVRAVDLSPLYSEGPYPWDVMPPDGIPFSARAVITAPAPTVQAVVLTYTVPKGFYACLKFVCNEYIPAAPTGGYIEGSGDVLWVIDVNKPLTGTNSLGRLLTDYAFINTSLGSVAQGPWPVAGALLFKGGDILRYKVTTTMNVDTGGENNVFAALIGWIWPQEQNR